MPVGWRVAKKRYPAYDGSGAMRSGARWNSPGQPVVYAADTYPSAILEILAHALRPRTLPGAHHAVRIEFSVNIVESMAVEDVPGWDAKDSAAALAFGDRWLAERRSAVLAVPALTCRPIGRVLMINPLHPDAPQIAVSAPFDVEWDERLF